LKGEKVIKKGKKKTIHFKERMVTKGKLKCPPPSHVWK
jgi:hypothetical protein